MKVKTKLIASIMSICLVCAVFAIGVFALKTANLKIGGDVSFSATGVEATISNATLTGMTIPEDFETGGKIDTSMTQSEIDSLFTKWANLQLDFDENATDITFSFNVKNDANITTEKNNYVEIDFSHSFSQTNPNVEVFPIASNEYFIAPGETKSFGVCLKVLDKEVNIKEGTKLDLNIILKHVTPVVGNVNGTKLTTADGVIYTLDKENYIAYLGHTGFVGDNLQLAYNKQEIIILPIVSDGTDNYMVTKIDSYAFADFMNGMPEETPGLESIIIPNSVTTIGHSSFLCLTDLSEIQFSKALKAGGVDFSGTSWFENQPDGVVYAGYVACGYKGTISDNLQIKPGTIAISADAFRDTALSSITIPSSVEYIGDYAFDECRSKSVIKIDSQTIVTGLNSFEAQGCLISGSLVTLSVYIKSDLDVTAATYLTNTANFTPEKVGDVVADADGDGYILYTKVGA